MRTKLSVSLLWLLSCLISGAAGGYGFMRAQQREAVGPALRTQQLELTDSAGNVRASFAVEQDESVSLRMFSKASVPIIELSVPGDQGLTDTSSGALVFRNASGKPSIQLHSMGDDKGSLSFSGPVSSDQVVVGYSAFGDVLDGHDRGMWGIQIAGPNHTSRGINLFAEDGIAKGFAIPLEAPRSAPE